jgi:ParB family chromosome partitioning protein
LHDHFLIEIEKVRYDDSTRQRKVLQGIEELASSIDRIGQLQAIILDEDNNLLAGRRRLEAVRLLGHKTILARRFRDLDLPTQKLVELDENLRRVGLSWQETAIAVFQLHQLQCSMSPTWDQACTADYIGYSEQYVSQSIPVGRALLQGDAKLAACGGLNSAADLLRRRRSLDLDEAMAQTLKEDGSLGDPEDDLFPSPLGEPSSDVGSARPLPEGEERPFTIPRSSATGGAVDSSPRVATPSSQFNIVAGDFVSLVKQGAFKKRYNLIHCDFPYGINFDKSDQGGSSSEDAAYKDSPELFWDLTHEFLAHQDDFIAPSAHMIFWFSMNYYKGIKDALESDGWFVVPTPLIWHKSDGAGIASDYRRRPKHIYETALFCSRGDRPILTMKNDHFSYPLARKTENHPSAKPQEMLEYFLSMVVTEHTDLLDPTCGSGTSIRAAAALGAKSALGIELNPFIASSSQTRLSNFLTKKDLPSYDDHE